MGLHIDPMPDDPTIQAAMYDPLVLAGRLNPVAKEMSCGDYELKPGDQQNVSDIAADPGRAAAWIEPDNRQPLTFHAVGQSQPLTMVPLYKVIHERYVVYWKVNQKSA
jgi:hypothetical protein